MMAEGTVMLLVRTILIGALLCLAGSAQGRMYLNPTDHGCADDMNTDDCFGPTVTAASGPTILACQALSTAGQQCRTCKDKRSATGVDLGYKYCGYVKFNAYCKCNAENTSECAGEGSCAYY